MNLDKAIETLQGALADSLREDLKIEITVEGCWIVYCDMKFLVESGNAEKTIGACIHLSGLEIGKI